MGEGWRRAVEAAQATRRRGPKFREGDKVRDQAGLGGAVLETWGNGVKVSWNNGTIGWVDERFLTSASPT